MAISHETRMRRLYLLREVMDAHVKARGRPLRLGYYVRQFHMNRWACNTYACALGSYALTSYGRRYFKNVSPFYRSGGTAFVLRQRIISVAWCEELSTISDAAKHFGIDDKESSWLFMPDYYSVRAYSGSAGVQPSHVRKRVDVLIKRYEKLYGYHKSYREWAKRQFKGKQEEEETV